MIGIFPILTIGFGKVLVYFDNREPKPPAKITTFTSINPNSYLYLTHEEFF